MAFIHDEAVAADDRRAPGPTVGDRHVGFGGRILIGVAAALVATSSKILAQDREHLQGLIQDGQYPPFRNYALLLLCILLLFSIVAAAASCASDETKPRKLFIVALTVPALASAWTADNRPYQSELRNVVQVEPADPTSRSAWSTDGPLVRPAAFRTGASHDAAFAAPARTAYVVNEPPVLRAGFITDKVRTTFGIGSTEPRYWVIVGSEKDRRKAEATVDAIRRADPGLKPFVGRKRPGDRHYPVIVGNFTARDDAARTLRRALKLDAVSDGHLDAFAERR